VVLLGFGFVGPDPNAGKSLGSNATSLLEEIDGAPLSPDGCTRSEDIVPCVPFGCCCEGIGCWPSTLDDWCWPSPPPNA